MENSTAVKLENNSNMSEKEFMLIQALVKEQLERGEQLEYEKFDGYELPPSTQFSMLKKPTVTIKYGKIRFNMAAIKLFSGIKYILPMIHKDKKRLAVVPCKEEENSSVEWARRRKKDDAWVNKEISTVDFVNKIFERMGWRRDCRYKIIGRIANSDKGLILLFDLEEAICFEPTKKEVVNPVTGKKTVVNNKIYPKKYEGKIGMDYNDYVSGDMNSKFENLGEYIEDSPVGDASEEPIVAGTTNGLMIEADSEGFSDVSPVGNASERGSDDYANGMTSNCSSDSSSVDNTNNNLDVDLNTATIENNETIDKQGLLGTDSVQSSGFDAGNSPSE